MQSLLWMYCFGPYMEYNPTDSETIKNLYTQLRKKCESSAAGLWSGVLYRQWSLRRTREGGVPWGPSVGNEAGAGSEFQLKRKRVRQSAHLPKHRDNFLCQPRKIWNTERGYSRLLFMSTIRRVEGMITTYGMRPWSASMRQPKQSATEWRRRSGRKASGGVSSSGSSPRWRNCRRRWRLLRALCGAA